MFLLSLAVAAPAAVQLPVTDGLDCWLRADAGVTTTGGLVDAWLDQSSSGLTFTSPAPTERPPLTPSVVNGLPAITFDGTVQLNGDSIAMYGECTVFALARYTVPSSDNDYLYTIGTDGGPGSQFTLARRSGDSPYHFDGSAQNIANDQSIPADVFQVLTQTFGEDAPERHKLFQNNFQIMETDAAAPYAVDASTFVIGNWSSGGFRFVGDLVELIVFDRVLDGAERLQIEDYLRRRADIPAFFDPLTEDMTDWEVVQYEVNAQPDADWRLRLSGRAVDQFVNCDPSIFLSQHDPGPAVFTGQLGSGNAPDYMGFAFGYQDRGHYYLFDWKKVTASFNGFGVGERGMSLRRVAVAGGGDPTGSDLWGSADGPNVTTLAGNDIPWVDGVDYQFTIAHEPPFIDIEIREGSTVLESWSLTDGGLGTGRFGYYVNSLQSVRFGRVLVEPISEVGAVYCDSGANSASAGGATLRATGSASVSANDLVLTCGPAPAGQAGIFFHAPGRTIEPAGQPFGEGSLCVTGTIVRILPPVFADGAGNLVRPLDNTDAIHAGWILAGATLNFQSWYRDPFAGDSDGDGVAEGFNLSSGLEVTFTP